MGVKIRINANVGKGVCFLAKIGESGHLYTSCISNFSPAAEAKRSRGGGVSVGMTFNTSLNNIQPVSVMEYPQQQKNNSFKRKGNL